MIPINRTNYCFKFLIFFIFTLIIGYTAMAQARWTQDVRRVTVVFQYVIENGEKIEKFFPVYQEIFDSLGRLHTEIEYNFIDQYPHFYRWNSFKGKQKIKTEFFHYEKIQMIKEYNYNRDSLVSQEIIKKVKPGDTVLYLTLNYRYNQNRKPITIEAKSANGKVAYITKSTYDTYGTELTRKVNVKAAYVPSDSIIKMTCKPQYDSIGRLIENTITAIKENQGKYINNYYYRYDKKSNIIGVTIKDGKGNLISREERIFQDDRRNRLWQVKYYNSRDILVRWTINRYEIYRKKIRLDREIDF